MARRPRVIPATLPTGSLWTMVLKIAEMVRIYEQHLVHEHPRERPADWDRFTHSLVKIAESVQAIDEQRLERARTKFFAEEVEQITTILRETGRSEDASERRRRIYQALTPIDWAMKVKNWNDTVDGIPREIADQFKLRKVFIPTPAEMHANRGPRETAQQIVASFHNYGSTGTARNRSKAASRPSVFDIVEDPTAIIGSIFGMLIDRKLLSSSGTWRTKTKARRRRSKR